VNLIDTILFYMEAFTINKIHSPFIYNLVSKGFDFSKKYYGYPDIELLRNRLKNLDSKIDFIDFGAKGSLEKNPSKTIKISDLAKNASSNKWKCLMIANLVSYFEPKSILELGTNLGLLTSYLRIRCPRASIVTVEGSASIARVAKRNFDLFNFKEIDMMVESFDRFFVRNSDAFDIAIIDGNHRGVATECYFEKLKENCRVVIIDDIRWSSDMLTSWNRIKKTSEFHAIDFYKFGILFKNKDIANRVDIKCLPRFLKPLQFGFFSE